MKKPLLRLLLIVLIGDIMWLSGLAHFASIVPRAPATDSTKADAIVVLTGGSARVERGFDLLKQGMAPVLFVTGVGKGVSLSELMAANQVPPELAPHIILDYAADTTKDNAAQTAQWVRSHAVKTIRLVTANYHLPRSLAEFSFVMPELEVIPDGVFPRDFQREQWWSDSRSRTIMLYEYHKWLATYLHHWMSE